jgi:hypothetical protein
MLGTVVVVVGGAEVVGATVVEVVVVDPPPLPAVVGDVVGVTSSRRATVVGVVVVVVTCVLSTVVDVVAAAFRRGCVVVDSIGAVLDGATDDVVSALGSVCGSVTAETTEVVSEAEVDKPGTNGPGADDVVSCASTAWPGDGLSANTAAMTAIAPTTDTAAASNPRRTSLRRTDGEGVGFGDGVGFGFGSANARARRVGYGSWEPSSGGGADTTVGIVCMSATTNRRYVRRLAAGTARRGGRQMVGRLADGRRMDGVTAGVRAPGGGSR